MNKSDQKRVGSDEVPTSENQMSGCLLRLYWMWMGNVSLVLIGIIISTTKNLLPLSILFWLITFSMILTRYLEIRYYKGQTSDCSGEATIQDWKKYSALLLLFSLILWMGLIVYRHYA